MESIKELEKEIEGLDRYGVNYNFQYKELKAKLQILKEVVKMLDKVRNKIEVGVAGNIIVNEKRLSEKSKEDFLKAHFKKWIDKEELKQILIGKE